ncbi:hypothetical protein PO909_018624 [Leuciscus waleckii]
MGGQVLRKLHAGGSDIHSRTIIISSGRAAASLGLLLFLSLSYGASCVALLSALSKSSPVYHSPLFPGPTYYPVQNSATGSGTDPARPDTGEPLGGGSDSDSDFGLGKFDCGSADTALRLDGAELENEFEVAADRVRDLAQAASREQLLYLYARFKQVKVGKCNTAKPGFFDFEGQRKWSAWKQLGDMSAEQAMQEYVSCVHALDPEGSEKSSERRGGYNRTGFGGPAVSSLYQEEKIREEDKNIFDYCRENNIEHVSKAISSKKVDVNTRDEERSVLGISHTAKTQKVTGCTIHPLIPFLFIHHRDQLARFISFSTPILKVGNQLAQHQGRALLHWACDRGHKDLVSLLLQNNADINSQVSV